MTKNLIWITLNLSIPYGKYSFHAGPRKCCLTLNSAVMQKKVVVGAEGATVLNELYLPFYSNL